MKIQVPAPVAAGTLASVILAAVFFVSRPNHVREPVGPSQGTAEQIRIIEVPVEREVLRERVVTRIVSVPGPRQFVAPQGTTFAKASRRVTLIAEGMSTGRGAPRYAGESFAPSTLVGFRPASDANLRIVKEPEQ